MLANQVSTDVAAKLTEGYREVLDHYRLLLEVTERQQKTIKKNSDLKELVNILDKRHDLMCKINQIEASLVPYKRKWKREENPPGNSSRGELPQLLEEIGSLLKKLLVLEEENENLFVHRAGELRKEISRVGKGRKAHSAYTFRNRPEARFMDRKS